jgi:CTP synthase
VSIGVVGKYVAMPDAYLSLMEALKHAGIANRARVDIDWVSAEAVADGDLQQLGGLRRHPGPGRLRRARHRGQGAGRPLRARGAVPFLGICLGMQVAVIDFARRRRRLEAANSTEFDPYTPHPVIDLMPEQLEVDGLGGTMRLGSWPMQVPPARGWRRSTPNGSRAAHEHLAGVAGTVRERHRHRYEVNPPTSSGSPPRAS